MSSAFEILLLFLKETDVLDPGRGRGGGSLDFEMGGGVRRFAPNVGSKERIFGKNRG